MKISRIYVSTCRVYEHFTQCCIASIRHWYPDIPIFLIKDYATGDFDTTELEKAWNVSVFPTHRKTFGLGWAKLEAFTATPPQRCLIIDCDIVFAGPFLEKLETFEEDFIVVEEDHPPESIEKDYFSISKLSEFDPEFRFPGFVFNTGQMVATSGVLTTSDFVPYISDTPEIHVLQPDVFPVMDQSVLNYLLLKKSSEKSLSLRRHAFMAWGPSPWLKKLSLLRICCRSPYHFLIHWAGKKSPDLGELPNGHLLKFFFLKYHLRVPGGWWKYFVRRHRQKQQAHTAHIWST